MEPGHDQLLPPDVVERLGAYGVHQSSEVDLRRLLEVNTLTYTLYRLAPAAARKWKARYRIMIGAAYIDCQSAAEAYARALLLTLESQGRTSERAPAPQNP